MVLLDEIHHNTKGFLEISKYYLRIRVKWDQNG